MGEDNFEISFQVLLKDRQMRNDLITELNKIHNIEQVRLYYDDDQN